MNKSVKPSSCDDEDKSFNEEDRKQLYKINDTIELMVEEIKMLKSELEKSNRKVSCLEIENARLKQAANLTLYKLDALEQYGRRENLKIHGFRESNDNSDDGEKVVLKVAEYLEIQLQANDIQRAHRLGKKHRT